MRAMLHSFTARSVADPVRFRRTGTLRSPAATPRRPRRVAVAYVFPGQGSQTVGMGRLLSSHSTAAAAAFAEADDVLGQPISRLSWEGPGPTLDLTVNAQPALLASSIALLRALREDAERSGVSLEAPAFFAGH